jgi:parallel beta-helix repeat protein
MKNLSFAALIFTAIAVFAQGDLAPPGAPAPTMKTLQQIEPRTLISSLPFTINQAGSYYLVSNLTGLSGQSGITIAAHNVTVDLNGFDLAGVSGSASGVTVNGTRTNLTLRNGTIRSWSGFGVGATTVQGGQFEALRVLHNAAGGFLAGVATTVQNVTAAYNGGAAISLREGSVIKNCTAFANAGVGISTLGGSTVENCAVRANRNGGIDAGRDSTVLGCTASTNTGHGILAGTNVLVKNCVVTRNTLNGIQADDNSTIDHCVSSQNGLNGVDAAVGCTITENTANQNLQNGFVINARCRVFGNTAASNGAFGVSGAGFYILGDDNHIEGNNSVRHYFGFLIDGDYNLIIKNKASDFSPPPGGGFSLDVGFNRIAPIVSDFTGAVSWANFAY